MVSLSESERSNRTTMAKDKANYHKGGPARRTFVRHNEQIRIPQVMVIHDGKNLGTMQTREALNLARSHGLDLVEVAPTARPPVCHITDYGKHMYLIQQKKKSAKQAGPQEKEVDFRYVIGDHDLDTKISQIKKFIEKGHKVKCVCKFHKREKAHKNLGFELLDRVIEKLKDIASVELAPRFEGGNVIAKLCIKKDKEKDEEKA